jgi:bifunctional non-homologous end joining protein LigD
MLSLLLICKMHMIRLARMCILHLVRRAFDTRADQSFVALHHSTMATRQQVKIGKRALAVSNLDKVLYPEAGFTKGDVIDYYVRIAPAVLPHLKGRPLTLKRYPNGVEGDFFYEKQCPVHRPDWVKTAAIWSRHRGKEIEFCVIQSVEALAWAANLADLELHPSLALAERIERPTVLAFDLDPGEGTDVLDCARVAFWLREMLDQWELESFVKTSGSKGLQLYIPLNTPVSYEETKPFAHALAQVLEKQHPEEVVSKMAKNLRKKKVFIDWSQNDEHKTTVGVYSLRAKSRPTVSTPVTWEELGEALEAGDQGRLVFEAEEVLARVERHGDLFKPVLTLKQRLPELG